MTAPVITLAGRRLRIVERPTLRMQLHLSNLAARGRLIDPMPMDGETPDAFALRVVGEANDAGALLELLGAMLMPESSQDSDWRQDEAEANAKLLGALQDEAEIARVRLLVSEALIPFMRAGLASYKRTLGASPDGRASAGQESPVTSNASSASGMKQSVPSRDGHRRPWWMSWAGRSRTSSAR